MQNRFDPECGIVPVPIVDDMLIRQLTVGLASSDVDAEAGAEVNVDVSMDVNMDTGAEAVTALCPRLEKLVLPECRHVSEEALLAFARSRTSTALASALCPSSPFAPLKHLDVRFAPKEAQTQGQGSSASSLASSLTVAGARSRSSSAVVQPPSQSSTQSFTTSHPPSFISSSIEDLSRASITVSLRYPVQDGSTPCIAESPWEGAMSISVGSMPGMGMGSFGWAGQGTQGRYTRR